MKLQDALPINSHTPIRIFCGCQTIFNGSKSDISENEWKRRVAPYMDCQVIKGDIINGIITLAI